MVKLEARTPLQGVTPIEIGAMTLSEVEPGVVTALAPFKGQEAALSKALEAAHGMVWPAPNRATGKAGARAIWFGRAQALLMGPAPDAGLAPYAALVDQSDAWSVAEFRGAGAEAVLARLSPIDLRPSQFKRGHTARTELAHMTASITKLSEEAFLIMVFRAFGRTLAHEITIAMEGVAARQAG